MPRIEIFSFDGFRKNVIHIHIKTLAKTNVIEEIFAISLKLYKIFIIISIHNWMELVLNT